MAFLPESEHFIWVPQVRVPAKILGAPGPDFGTWDTTTFNVVILSESAVADESKDLRLFCHVRFSDLGKLTPQNFTFGT
jgi:hypothetical protein